MQLFTRLYIDFVQCGCRSGQIQLVTSPKIHELLIRRLFRVSFKRNQLNHLIRMIRKYCFVFIFSMRPSIVAIFFREQDVTLLKRVEVYTYIDFVAICGGLLGLFLGASVLSLVEFLYYSTLRLFWTFRKWKSESKIVPLIRTPFDRVSIDLFKMYNEMFKRDKPKPFKRPFIPNWYAYRH